MLEIILIKIIQNLRNNSLIKNVFCFYWRGTGTSIKNVLYSKRNKQTLHKCTETTQGSFVINAFHHKLQSI